MESPASPALLPSWPWLCFGWASPTDHGKLAGAVVPAGPSSLGCAIDRLCEPFAELVEDVRSAAAAAVLALAGDAPSKVGRETFGQCVAALQELGEDVGPTPLRLALLAASLLLHCTPVPHSALLVSGLSIWGIPLRVVYATTAAVFFSGIFMPTQAFPQLPDRTALTRAGLVMAITTAVQLVFAVEPTLPGRLIPTAAHPDLVFRLAGDLIIVPMVVMNAAWLVGKSSLSVWPAVVLAAVSRGMACVAAGLTDRDSMMMAESLSGLLLFKAAYDTSKLPARAPFATNRIRGDVNNTFVLTALAAYPCVESAILAGSVSHDVYMPLLVALDWVCKWGSTMVLCRGGSTVMANAAGAVQRDWDSHFS